MVEAVGKFINPNTGNLVLDSNAINYKYLGQPTLVTSATKSAYYYSPLDVWWGSVTPYIYEFTLPNSSMIPLVGVKLRSDAVVAYNQPYLVSGSTWRIEIYSVASAYSDDIHFSSLATPTVYIFCPYSNTDAPSSGDAAFIMRNSAGNISFSSKAKPLWIKQAVVMNENHSGSLLYDAYGWTTSPPNQFYGMSFSWTPISNAVAINTCNIGSITELKDSSGEEIYTALVGWYIDGNYIKTKSIVNNHNARVPEAGDYTEYDLGWYGVNLFLVDGAIL